MTDSHLVLHNQLEGSFLRKTISSAFSISLLPIVSCLGLRFHKLFPFHINMSVGVLIQVLFRQPCLLHFLDVASSIFLEDSISQQTSYSSASYNLSALSSPVTPEAYMKKCCRCLCHAWLLEEVLQPVVTHPL